MSFAKFVVIYVWHVVFKTVLNIESNLDGEGEGKDSEI
jgi:hypothetical protein